jgi:hypothetical protein
MPMPSVLKMADFWRLEPPFAFMYRVRFFKREESADPNAISPVFGTGNYHKLPKHLQNAVRASWIKRHPGKTDSDFLKAVKAKALEKYGKKLEEAREQARKEK